MFGNNDAPIPSMISGAFDNIDRAVNGREMNADWMRGKKKPAATPAAPSLVTAPTPAPAMVDTPGRHKTLLGA